MEEVTTPTTVWITKYALTAGIQECELISFVGGTGTKLAVDVKWPGGYNNEAMFFGTDWHDTKEKAIADAIKKRDRKIKSLEKQIAKLKAMTF